MGLLSVLSVGKKKVASYYITQSEGKKDNVHGAEIPMKKDRTFLVLRFVGICQFKFSGKPWQDKLAQGTYVHALARAGAQWIKKPQ